MIEKKNKQTKQNKTKQNNKKKTHFRSNFGQESQTLAISMKYQWKLLTSGSTNLYCVLRLALNLLFQFLQH